MKYLNLSELILPIRTVGMIIMIMNTADLLKEFKAKVTSEDYQGASSFLDTNKSFFEESVYLLNQGILKSKMGNFSEARLLLEKSKKLGAESEKLNTILEETKTSLGVKKVEKPVSISGNIYFYTDLISPVVLIFFSLLFYIALLKWIKRIDGLTNKIFLFSFATLPLLCSAYYYSLSQYVNTQERFVREGPSNIFEENFVLPKGVKIAISKYYNGWGYIAHPERLSGWIKIDDKEKI